MPGWRAFLVRPEESRDSPTSLRNATRSASRGSSPVHRLAVAIGRQAPRLAPKLLEEGLGFRVRRGVQLPVQPQPQLPVAEQGRGIVPARRQHLHQGALRALPQRVDRYRQPQVPLCVRRLAFLQRQVRQLLPRGEIAARGPAAPGTPTPRTSFQERAPVKEDRCSSAVAYPPKGRPRRRRHPLRRPEIQQKGVGGGGGQRRPRGRAPGAQIHEAAAQVVESPAVRAFGPERSRQPGPLHRPAAHGARGARATTFLSGCVGIGAVRPVPGSPAVQTSGSPMAPLTRRARLLF